MSWWLSGGISSANCLAAYQPIGADDLADSYVNLANPGTYDAAPGDAPNWDAINGWKFNGSSDYLTTGIALSLDTSVIIRISNAPDTSGSCIGLSTAKQRYRIYPYYSPLAYYSFKNSADSSNNFGDYITSGIICLTAAAIYVNATSRESVSASLTNGNIIIGADYGSDFFVGYVQAIAIYNKTISQDEVTALTTAMALLPAEASGIAIPIAQYYYDRLRRK